VVESVEARPQSDLDTPEATLSEEMGRRVDFFWSLSMVGSLGLLFLLLAVFQGVAVPVLLSLALAYVLNPVVTFLAQKGWSRAPATAAVFLGLILIIAAAVFYAIPVFKLEAAKLPHLFRRASGELVPRVEILLGVSVPELIHRRTAELGNQASEILQSAGPVVAGLAAAFAGNTARLIATVLGLLVVPVIGFFFLRDYPRLIHRAKALLPRWAVGLISRRFREVDEVLSAFVRGQLTAGVLLSILYSAGLSAAQVDMPILIGMITGFGNMVPYLGTAIGLLLALLSAMLAWQGAWQLAVIFGTFVFAQAIEALVITPRVVGRQVGLPPAAVIIAVLAFGELFGFAGILLAVPSSAILKVVLKVVLERYRKTALYTGEGARG
jgi:predicted PurR-regulated permease PerM